MVRHPNTCDTVNVYGENRLPDKHEDSGVRICHTKLGQNGAVQHLKSSKGEDIQSNSATYVCQSEIAMDPLIGDLKDSCINSGEKQRKRQTDCCGVKGGSFAADLSAERKKQNSAMKQVSQFKEAHAFRNTLSYWNFISSLKHKYTRGQMYKTLHIFRCRNL